MDYVNIVEVVASASALARPVRALACPGTLAAAAAGADAAAKGAAASIGSLGRVLIVVYACSRALLVVRCW